MVMEGCTGARNLHGQHITAVSRWSNVQDGVRDIRGLVSNVYGVDRRSVYRDSKKANSYCISVTTDLERSMIGQQNGSRKQNFSWNPDPSIFSFTLSASGDVWRIPLEITRND